MRTPALDDEHEIDAGYRSPEERFAKRQPEACFARYNPRDDRGHITRTRRDDLC